METAQRPRRPRAPPKTRTLVSTKTGSVVEFFIFPLTPNGISGHHRGQTPATAVFAGREETDVEGEETQIVRGRPAPRHQVFWGEGDRLMKLTYDPRRNIAYLRLQEKGGESTGSRSRCASSTSMPASPRTYGGTSWKHRRAPQTWHQDAVRAAYESDDEAWRLTAVFCMRFVRGFDEQILEALNSRNPDIHYEAVLAAGNWAVEAAWPHVAALVTSGKTDKPVLLAAIDAVASIRPHEAAAILDDLADSDDEDIVAAVHEAMAVAEGPSDEDEDGELNDDDEFLH